MTDTERDPTRTEDVEERARGALQELEKFASRSWSPQEQPYTPDELGNMVRERLEEVEEERERLKRKVNKWIFRRSAARRRSEALEGAVRTVLNEHRIAEDWSLPKRLEEYLLGVMADIDEPEPQGGELADRLRSALDSREDEGEVTVSFPDPSEMSGLTEDEAEAYRGIRERLVHADEPEGEDCTCPRYGSQHGWDPICPRHGSDRSEWCDYEDHVPGRQDYGFTDRGGRKRLCAKCEAPLEIHEDDSGKYTEGWHGEKTDQRPVHADEPEGDEAPAIAVCGCGAILHDPVSHDCDSEVWAWAHRDQTQPGLYSVLRTAADRSSPTDEPVSREGEESTVKALWSFASDHVPCDGDVSIHVVEIDGDPYFALRCDPCNAVLKVRNEADYPVDFPPTPVSEVSPHLRPTDPTTHADARSETAGEFGDPPHPGESKKQFAERVLDEAQEAPSWDAYVYSLACGLYDAEKQTYPEPSMESDGTALSDRHEEEGP